jgi:hypothetical protein
MIRETACVASLNRWFRGKVHSKTVLVGPPRNEYVKGHRGNAPCNNVFVYSGILFQFLEVRWDWANLVRRPLINLLYQPQVMDDDERGAVGGMRIGRRNRSTRRKLAPVPLCPPQIPHDLALARTRTSLWEATNHLSYGSAYTLVLI